MIQQLWQQKTPDKLENEGLFHIPNENDQEFYARMEKLSAELSAIQDGSSDLMSFVQKGTPIPNKLRDAADNLTWEKYRFRAEWVPAWYSSEITGRLSAGITLVVDGILPMIVGSIYVTIGAIIVGVPIGILTSVFMAFYCPKQIYKPLKTATELLAGIPSVVYGFFGLVVLVPLVRQLGRDLGFGGNGSSMLTASLILGMMILPTIIGLTESALRAVPGQYYEGAVALGATHERAIFRVVLPAAKSGTVAAIVLGVGRAIGETMAVIMVAGNQTWMPKGLFKGVRTLTANIVIEMGYATDLH